MDNSLIESARKGDLPGIKDALLRGANVNATDLDKQAALHRASSNGYTEIVQLLLQYNADTSIRDKDGNTALHIACKNSHINVIQYLLSQGADISIKNNEGKTPLDECQDTSKEEIVSLVSEYNPKRALHDVSKWNIEYLNEEQVFEKPEYGVKFVIPPSSVEIGQEVKTEVKVVAPEESEIILPPEVELVSCFYKIKTTEIFSKPVDLHLQHNVELRSQEESQQLAFIRAKGPPPYKFELLSNEYDQVFRPYDKYGVIGISDFCLIAIVKKIKDVLFRQSRHSYVMTVFFKEKRKFCWEIQAVVTKNLGPFLERVNTEKRFENWKRIHPVAIVDPDINEVTIANECYDIKPMMNPFQLSRKIIDQYQPGTALPCLNFIVSFKDKKEFTDLELTFRGKSQQTNFVIPSYELQQIKETTILEDVSKWNIEYLNEEQVVEKQGYGVKFVIPPLSVEKVTIQVNVVAPTESEIILPLDVELVSCLYKIKKTGKFIRPIKLHLQHNVELRSQEESQQLAFIRAKGSPPYKFELLSTQYDQVFVPYDNYGVVRMSDFSVIGIVIRIIKGVLFRQPSRSYVMTVFYKEIIKYCWEIQAVVTKNLGPFLERVNTEKRFENWKRIDPVTIVDPDINEVTIANECYDIKPMMNPFQLSRMVIDQCQPDSALPSLKFEVSLKNEKELTDLELTFKGKSLQKKLVIAVCHLQQQQETTSHSASTPSTNSHPSIHMPSSYHRLGISDKLLCKEPKRKHLMTILHEIRCKWEIIGEQLAVKDDYLKSFEHNVAYNDTINLSKVLQVWRNQRTCEISWRKIITVVEDPPVENKAVAEKIFYYLSRPDVKNQYFYQPGQEITTFNSPPPIYQEPIKTKGKDGSWFMLLLVAIFVAVIAYFIYIAIN